MTPITDEAFYRWKRGDNMSFGPYFSSHEFECPCGCEDQLLSRELIVRASAVRVEWGRPIHVVHGGGYRCAKYQEGLLNDGSTKTVKKSQHVLGNAMDPSQPMGAEDRLFLLAIASKHFKAIGVGMMQTHWDVRDDKQRRWWY